MGTATFRRSTVRDGGDDIVIVDRRDATTRDRLAAMPSGEAEALLGRWLVERRNTSALASVLARLSPTHATVRGLDRSAVRTLADAVRTGRVIFLRAPRTRPAIPPPTPEPDESSDAPAEQETTWIGVELLDAEGKPVAGARYKIELPDGRVREGRLDRDGRARENGITPGTCKVNFPEYDRDAWQPA